MATRMPRSGGGDSGTFSHQVLNPFSLGAPIALGLVFLVGGLLVRDFLATDGPMALVWGALLLVTLAGVNIGVYRAKLEAKGKLGELGRWVAVIGTAGGSLWTVAIAEVPGSLTWRPFVGYTIPWAGVTLVQWFTSAARADAKSAEGAGWGSPLDGIKGAVGQLKSAQVKPIKPGDDRFRAAIEMRDGETIEDLSKASASLASHLGVRAGGVKIFPGDANASAASGILEVQPIDPFAKPQAWPGPNGDDPRGDWQRVWHLRPMPTLADPISLGPESDIYLTGDPTVSRNASMIQMVGMNGAGKTTAISLLAIGIMARPDARYIYCDGRKAAQQDPWLLAGADAVYRTNKDIVKFLKWLRDVFTPIRTAELGALGLSQYLPGCGLRHWTIIVDEALSFAQDAERLLSDLMETMRSLGVVFVFGLQQAGRGRWPTAVRSQIGTAITMGVATIQDSEMALSELQEEGGCSPHMWRNNHPGKFYLDAPHLDDEGRLRERRFWYPDKSDLKAVAAMLIEARPAATPMEAAAQPATASMARSMEHVEVAELVDDADDDLYGEDSDDEMLVSPRETDDEVIEYVDLETEDEDELAERLRAAQVLARDLDVEDSEEEGDDYDEASDLELPPPIEIPDEMRAEARAAEGPMDAPPGEGFQLRQEPRMSDVACRRYLASWIEAQRAEGRAELRAAELDDVLYMTHKSGSWLKKWLDRFCVDPEYAHLGLSKIGPREGYAIEPLPRELARG